MVDFDVLYKQIQNLKYAENPSISEEDFDKIKEMLLRGNRLFKKRDEINEIEYQNLRERHIL